MPPGKKLKFVNVTDLMVEAASFFDLEDVRKASAETKGDARGSVDVKTDAGLSLKLVITTDKTATWARIEATGTGDAVKAASEIPPARPAGIQDAAVESLDAVEEARRAAGGRSVVTSMERLGRVSGAAIWPSSVTHHFTRNANHGGLRGKSR